MFRVSSGCGMLRISCDVQDLVASYNCDAFGVSCRFAQVRYISISDMFFCIVLLV